MRSNLYPKKGICWCMLLFISCLALVTNAQHASSIADLEAQLIQSEDTEYIQTALLLSKAYLAEKSHYKAIQRALTAFETAQRLNDKYYMALALNYEGQAVRSKESSRMANAETANEIAKKFAGSLQLLQGIGQTELKLDNLRQLQGIARDIGNNELAIQYQKQIELVEEGLMSDPVAIGINGLGSNGDSDRNTRTNIFNKSKKEAQALNEKMDVLSEEAKKLEAEKELLNTERELMERHMDQQRTAIAQLSQDQLGNELLITHQRILMDSLQFARQIDSFKLQRQQSELMEKESTLRIERYQRRLIIAVSGIVLLILLGILFRYNIIKRNNKILGLKNERIKEAQSRSDELLRNILPASIAEELKVKGITQPKQHKQVTVMFTDFKDFSAIAEQLSADELVSELHHCFKAFDEIIDKYGLEKIKTIGDAYMCAGGLPSEDPEHPHKLIAAAMDIQDFLKQWNSQRVTNKAVSFEARIGIHTGPVVAGVVGIRKFAYDMWGDTVNIASRMESHSEPGRINISSSTYALVKDKYHCVHRGKLPTRKDGDVEMYFVEGVKTEAAAM